MSHTNHTKALLCALCALVLSIAFPAAAEDAVAPDELVRELSAEVIDILRTDDGLRDGDTAQAIDRIEQIVLPHFNFSRMTMLAVGRDWRRATPEQRQRLIDAFYSMLVRTYSNALTQYRDQTIDFSPLRMNPGDTTVRVQTAVRQPGAQPVKVDYVLEKTEDGWMVFDVVVAGVSLVTNYRGTFAQEIRAGGIDGLISALEARDAKTAPAPGQSS